MKDAISLRMRILALKPRTGARKGHCLLGPGFELKSRLRLRRRSGKTRIRCKTGTRCHQKQQSDGRDKAFWSSGNHEDILILMESRKKSSPRDDLSQRQPAFAALR
jgi:hypothetical protein